MAILITGMFAPSGGAGSFNLYDPADMEAGNIDVLLTLIAGGKITAGGTAGEIIIQTGAITPVHSATEGTLYWDTAADILYCNNNGTTGWTAVGASAGSRGPQGFPGIDGEDSDSWVIPGPIGATGAAGATGSTGAAGADGRMGPPGQDGDESSAELWFPPGSTQTPVSNLEPFAVVGSAPSLPNRRLVTPRNNMFGTDAGAGGAYSLDSWVVGDVKAPSAAVLPLGSQEANAFHVSAGNFATITQAMASPLASIRLLLVFNGVSVVTHGAGTDACFLSGATNFTSAAGDTMEFLRDSLASGPGWREISRTLAAGAAAGPTGPTGADGRMGPPGQDGEDGGGDWPLIIPETPSLIGTYATRPATMRVGGTYTATDRANTLYQYTSTGWIVVNPRTFTMDWYIDGRLRADASNAQGPIRYLPDLDGMTTETVALWKPVRAKAVLRTTSAGASVLIMIEYGTTATPVTDLFTAANRITIAAASVEATSTTFEDSAIENGTAFEILIDQVGSTAGSEGTDLSVELEFVQIDA